MSMEEKKSPAQVKESLYQNKIQNKSSRMIMTQNQLDQINQINQHYNHSMGYLPSNILGNSFNRNSAASGEGSQDSGQKNRQ